MKSEISTVQEYLDALLPKRGDMIKQLRSTILKNLPCGYVEVINWGMITYEVPLAIKSDTYNKKPLMYAAIGNQKAHVGVYLCGLYCVDGLVEDFMDQYMTQVGKNPNMGKACVRFKESDVLPLELIGNMIAKVSVDEYIAIHDKVHKK